VKDDVNNDVNERHDSRVQIKSLMDHPIMDLRNYPADLTPKDKFYNDEYAVNPSPMQSEDMQHKIAEKMKERELQKLELSHRYPPEDDTPQEDVRVGFENVPKKRLKKKKILNMDRDKNNSNSVKTILSIKSPSKIHEEEDVVDRNPSISQVKLPINEYEDHRHPFKYNKGKSKNPNFLDTSVERKKTKKKKKKKVFNFQEANSNKDFNDVIM
jgi:hypothetical protein